MIYCLLYVDVIDVILGIEATFDINVMKYAIMQDLQGLQTL